MTKSTAASPAISTARRRPGALALLSIAQFLIALDYSIIYVALPNIADSLHLASAIGQWVVSAYAVLFAGFLMFGGRLADRLGGKRLFMISITIFGLASAVGGLANSDAVLLIARGVQGFGAALLQPAILALIGISFPSGPVRSRALAIWGSVGASGLAAGVVLGGLLTSLSWRLTFFINVPFTLLCAVGAATAFTQRTDAKHAKRIPVLASVLGTSMLLSLVIGLTLSAERGWTSVATVSMLVLAVLVLIGFLVNEKVSPSVLIDPVLRRTRSLRIGAAATALYMASVGSEFYLVTLLLQSAKDYTPLAAGFAFLPLAGMVTFGNMAAGRAVRRWSPATVLICGFTTAAAGLCLLSVFLQGDSYVVDLLPGLLISGFGHGVIYTSMFIIGTRDAPAEYQGMTGALLTTSQYLSAAVTVAILTLVLGNSPDHGSFRISFLITTGAAAAGGLLILSRFRFLTAATGYDAPAGPADSAPGVDRALSEQAAL
ncbi:MAG: hypothetical protein QOE53_1163 [Pseudonocardiales bacterium]|jgi:EmrB/QacA subfamily drug resistance transporter|nr:hypothetical protein [Pseudonocardiales bacterium]